MKKHIVTVSILRKLGVTLSVLAILIIMVVASTVDYESIVHTYLHDSSTYIVIEVLGLLCGYGSYRVFSLADKMDEEDANNRVIDTVVGVPMEDDPLLIKIREGERRYNEFKKHKKLEDDMLKNGKDTMAKAAVYKEE